VVDHLLKDTCYSSGIPVILLMSLGFRVLRCSLFNK